MRVFNLRYQELTSEQVEEAAESVGLEVFLDGTLTKYPGSLHWHLRKKKGPGTLEITCWPMSNRLWMQVSGGREAPWIDEVVAQLQKRWE